MGNNDPALSRKFIRLLEALRPQLVCDIGSMDGAHAIAFKQALPTSRVIAFEANPYNYAEALRKRLLARAGVEWEHLALSDRDDVANFNASTFVRDRLGEKWTMGGSSLLKPTRTDLGFQQIVVPCARLDTYLGDRGLVDYGKALWIDVEGAADLLLTGAVKSLKTTLLIHIEVEATPFFVGQRLDREVVPRLERFGFVPIMSGDSGGSVQYDVLFLAAKIFNALAD